MSKPNYYYYSLFLLLLLHSITIVTSFEFEECTIESIQAAFTQRRLTSYQLTKHYIARIQALNPVLHAVIELNPDALEQAEQADKIPFLNRTSVLHGIPVLIKDNIATKDKLNTTSGSFSLLNSVVNRDAGIVQRLRNSGAIILGKSSMSEWCNFRSFGSIPSGWSARGSQGKNPYNLSAIPCGSSSGSAISVAANLVPVTIGTETDGSIICPSSFNSVVGIKPTVGLTSRAGVMMISPTMDTIGPICRTVSDAVYTLEAIVGYDPLDSESTKNASIYIPKGGYKQFLKIEGLKGKRLGILRKGFFEFNNGSVEGRVFEQHFLNMKKMGAILIDNLEIENVDVINDSKKSGEWALMQAQFKLALNSYLLELLSSQVRSLQDVIDFNNNHPIEENMEEYDQSNLIESQKTSGIQSIESRIISNLNQLSELGLEKLFKDHNLDAIITPGATSSSILAIGGFPGISVPAGYSTGNVPFGICFGGLKGFESRLIEIAFGFEQATKVRKPPSFEYFDGRFYEDEFRMEL